MADDAAMRARVQRLAAELRCLVCQNQSVADSQSALAEDLRRELQRRVARGDSDAQIVQYMTERYGDFVLYRPPWRPSTALLWLGPGVLLGAGAGALLFALRRRARLPAERFDADADTDDPPPR